MTTLPRAELFNRELGMWIEPTPENIPVGWQPQPEQVPKQEEEEQEEEQYRWPQGSGEYMSDQGGWPQW